MIFDQVCTLPSGSQSKPSDSMKNILALAFILLFFISCGGDDSKKTEKDTTANEAAEADITKHPDYQKGLELASKSDCFTCHAIEDKLTGPSYREIANKYASMPDTIISHLAGKVITGGAGVWGEIIM